MSLIQNLLARLAIAMKQPLESFVHLETADDATTLVDSKGALMTAIRVHGLFGLVGDEEFADLAHLANEKLSALLNRPGLSLQMFFSRDPDRMAREMERYLRPSRAAAADIGLDLKDIFDEQRDVLTNHLSHETCYFALWTHPAVLTKVERRTAYQRVRQLRWIRAFDAQFPHQALDELRARHRGKVGALKNLLADVGIKSEVLEVHDAVAAIRGSIYHDRDPTTFRACLPGDTIPTRIGADDYAGLAGDASDVLWPPLRRQIMTDPAIDLSTHSTKIGNLIWTGVDMTVGPQTPATFPYLLRRLHETRTPFRVSFLIQSAGMAGMRLKKFAATMLSKTSENSRLVAKSIEALQERAHKDNIVKLRCSFATWAPADQPRLLETRVAQLTEAIEQWGQCQASQIAGDPTEAVMSSAFGCHTMSTAPAAAVPLADVVAMLPIQRPASPFETGPLIFRTNDGRPFPHQLGSSQTNTWCDLIEGTPGHGKSVLLNTLNLGRCIAAGTTELPYISIIDFGRTSEGAISLIREALPLSQRHQAVYAKLEMSRDHAINAFDTPPGLRRPLPDQRVFLSNLLNDIATPAGASLNTAMSQLITLVIDEMYRRRDDSEANAEPHPYYPGIDPAVDDAIAAARITIPDYPRWWDIVDLLFKAGHRHEASLAQRHAVPQLQDAPIAAQHHTVADLFAETELGGGSHEDIIKAFTRTIAAAMTEFPIFAGATKFDIGTETRICALDLMAVAPEGGPAAKRQSAIMFLVARHALTHHWWLDKLIVDLCPPLYREYYAALIPKLLATHKRFSKDELHRTPKDCFARAQDVRDAREGRKFGVELCFASQLVTDFDTELRKLASGIWLTGSDSVSGDTAKDIAEAVSLSREGQRVYREELTGPRPGIGAAILLIIATKDRRFEQWIINTIGPQQIWATTTTTEDVAIRAQLYEKLGARPARQILAQIFPTGSAKTEVERRRLLRAEQGIHTDSAARQSAIDGLVTEILGRARPTLPYVPDTREPVRDAAD